jgi:hypothetical protein
MKRVKKALALAISWGVFIFLLSVFFLFEGWSACEPDWRSTVLSAAIALLQVILVFSAMRAYHFMERDIDDRQILATRALIGITGIVLGALFIPTFVLPHNAIFESASVDSLRTIVAAQRTYADEHKSEGFASSLSQLGASPESAESAGLIDAVLASGKKSGYVFTLRTGPGQADGRITKYTLLQGQQGIAGVEFIAFSRMKQASFGTPAIIAPPQRKIRRLNSRSHLFPLEFPLVIRTILQSYWIPKTLGTKSPQTRLHAVG